MKRSNKILTVVISALLTLGILFATLGRGHFERYGWAHHKCGYHHFYKGNENHEQGNWHLGD